MLRMPERQSVPGLSVSEPGASLGSQLAAISRLEPGEVHLWMLHPEPNVDLAPWLRLLSPAEQQRAARFHFPHLTRNFIADHARLRLILGAYTQTAAGDLTFSENAYGKPRLQNPASPVHFNLSHTAGLTLLALCLNSELGLDVEAIRPMDDWRDVARSHFSASENDALHRTAEADRQHAFFRCWTRKEAFLKASGEGLSRPLEAFSVSLDREAFPAFLSCAWDESETTRWSLVSLDPGPGFAGALALRSREPQNPWVIRTFNGAALSPNPHTERACL